MGKVWIAGVVAMWLTAMTALFIRDVLPAWTAQNPPPMDRKQFLADEQQQLAICKANGERLGTAWDNLTSVGNNTAVYTTVLLTNLKPIPPLLIDSLTEFDEKGRLDSFRLDVHGMPMMRIKVRGERHGIYFPVDLQVGPMSHQANLDLAASCMIGDSLRPFSYLPKLAVGQAWRMQMLNPLSMLQGKAQFNSIVARVTQTEPIENPLKAGESVECFVVETFPSKSKAWVDASGQVLVQEAEVPVLGKIVVTAEPYNETARDKARNVYLMSGFFNEQPDE